MTIEELQELTGQEFKFVALDKDDNIKFAVPIPGVDAWQFSTEEQIQDFIWDPEEIEACECESRVKISVAKAAAMRPKICRSRPV
ncbi:hypothetical protein D3Z48_18885, partial [Clostridiaceae bacterium]|nr:hypothetical protein [Clostridiaceae bacterium]